VVKQRLKLAAVAPALHDLFQGDDAPGWKTLPCSIIRSARSFRRKPKPLRPKVGNGSRSRSTCPMATAMACGGWAEIRRR
jgi:hypothetical protein